MTYQFQTLSENASNGPVRATFLEAWDDMFNYINPKLTSGNLSLLELETTMWIEEKVGSTKLPIMFYDARDCAITEGWELPK